MQLPGDEQTQWGKVHPEKLAELGRHVLAIVHELNNPLSTILGNAQRLQSQSAGQFPEVRRILAEAERAAGILRQLLFFSPDTRTTRQEISLRQLVEQTAELQRAGFAPGEAGKPRLLLDLAEDVPLVQADYGQLQQVLLNLLQNARQAMESSGLGSAIGVRTGLTPSGQVQWEVWDDGPGIPREIQSRIFEPFFTTKPAGSGSGLGLAIVQSFVRQHGGTVTFFSRAPSGSRFLMTLPAARQKVAGRPPAAGNTVHLPAGGIPPRILVVEDEPTVAVLIADVLREQGMKVDVLADARAALQQAQGTSYDLAICDIKMPGLDGPLFHRSLVQAESPLQHRVLFVTGDWLAPRTREFLEKNRLAHLAKPFRVEELSAAVHQALLQKKSAAGA